MEAGGVEEWYHPFLTSAYHVTGVNLAPCSIFPRGESTWCPLNRRGRVQGQSGCFGIEKCLLSLLETFPRFLGYTAIA
jgi:hypothetical protein